MTSTRDDIVAVADDLFYRRGYEHTSFSDIADMVKISRGNFYHHFKTKDNILEAVIRKRLSDREAMLAKWEVEGATPEERIGKFIDILLVNREKIRLHGCPVGTLSTELAKLDHAARDNANELLTLFRVWLRRQFTALGFGDEADQLALHVLARSQGAATLYNAFQDDTFVQAEVRDMRQWVRSVIATARRQDNAEG